MPRDNIKLLKRQTDEFIEANPMDVLLRYSDLTKDDTGGWTASDDEPRNNGRPQRARLVSQLTGAQGLVRETVDGREVQASHVLIGEHDMDIGIGDKFTMNTKDYEVIWVREDRRYETWAEVHYRG